MDIDLKTLIATEKPKFDVNDKYLPQGSYSFNIERFGDGETGNVTGIVSGSVKDEVEDDTEKPKTRELNERYTFKYFSVIQMMAKSQSQIARRARVISTKRIETLDYSDIPAYPSPNNSPGIMRNVKLDETMRGEYSHSSSFDEDDERDRKNSSESFLSRASSNISSNSHNSNDEWVDRQTGFSMEMAGPPVSSIVTPSAPPPLASSPTTDIQERKRAKREKRNKMREYFAQRRKTLPQCMICLTNGRLDKTLDCGHKFHYRCIAKWVTDCEKTCPICRADISDFVRFTRAF